MLALTVMPFNYSGKMSIIIYFCYSISDEWFYQQFSFLSYQTMTYFHFSFTPEPVALALTPGELENIQNKMRKDVLVIDAQLIFSFFFHSGHFER